MKDNLDIRIKEMLNNNLQDAPHNEWFTKKVMNRLPERKSRPSSVIENAGFIIAGIVIIISWYCQLTDTLQSHIITRNDAMYYVIISSSTVALLIAFIKAQLYKI